MSANCNPVGWFEIYVQDMARARAFYENTFGVTLTQIPGPIPEIELWGFPKSENAPGCTGALVKMAGKDSGPGGTIIYFPCEDCTVVAERAAKNGGTIQREKFAIGQYGFIAFLSDTEGNVIGLHSMR